LPPFAAEWCLSAPTFPPTISTPVSTDALVCCLSAAVSLQMMRWLFNPAQKLPLPVAEAGATSSMCVRVLMRVYQRMTPFKRALAQAGVCALVLACLLLLYARK
jgi:hypothetical protein